MVGIQVRKKAIFVHRKLLESVTHAFDGVSIDDFRALAKPSVVDRIPTLDVETFERFLTWLYSHSRHHYMGLQDVDALVALYCLSFPLSSEILRADALLQLSHMISLVSHCAHILHRT